ncbi:MULTISPECIES: phasin family protein [Pontibacillus]|uniref:Polyhydroxyalkanoate synthesis regulator phasin n=1 Tax=Pontibacillus chungwhensis TaxID=265426 RepID=A0ABY8UZY5_9BACI|nr:hypothetical protein [Pontibacillus chungwhensis]MCD5323993.1 hypothetical protein [Pontibacillus sp. HN14]WIF97944.1 hypothetical protein QNI29_19810 [Pontibacillus chungwhensis]
MSDLLKKGFLIGIGAALNGKEKVEKVYNEMVEKGQISPSEAKEAMREFRERGEAQNEKWNAQTEAYFREQIRDLGFVTKEEYHALEERIQKLEQLHQSSSSTDEEDQEQ